jgi:hypothetical protein
MSHALRPLLARHWLARHWLAPLGLSLLTGCVPALTLDEPNSEELAPEETRTVELRYLRLDAKGFAQTLTKADIKARFPERILRETWLLDMPIEPLITNALTALVNTSAAEAYTLDQSSLNMWKLLNMTPANTVLAGSSLAGLLGIGEAIGLPPSLVLSDLIGIESNTGIISVALATPAILKYIVATHPNAQKRRAPLGSTCPDGKPEQNGLCAVAPASMPVSLWDVVTDFQDLKTTFGPAPSDPSNPKADIHPGFIKDASPIAAATDEFEMTVRVNLNALPYKGVDLTNATIASVNSTSSQVAEAFDFSTPDWMEIKGLVPNLVIDEMTMAIYENPDFIASGTSKATELGDSPVWDLPVWQFERLIAELAVLRAQDITPHCSTYALEGDVEEPYEAIGVCMGDNSDPEDGSEPDAWVTLSVDEIVKLEDPLPAPSYFWDILLEVAQLRLHDGGLDEGDGDIAFKLRNIAAGISTADLEKKIRENIMKNPAALAAIAELLNENTDGAADFFYYVPGSDVPPEQRGDWLFFVHPEDILNDAQGDPVRPYDYPKNPGFFADPEGKKRVSSKVELDGDTFHEKVKINPGDVLYVKDDDGAVFRLEVNTKPDRHVVSLAITRTF